MSNRRAFGLLMVWIIVCIGGVYATYQAFYGRSTPAPLMVTPATRAPTFTPDVPAMQTADFERTAIAIFTQNPTLALSSTPYYAEIIYNEIVRQYETPGYDSTYRAEGFAFMTETAVALMTTTPTPIPPIVLTSYLTASPTGFWWCRPVAGNLSLSAFSNNAMRLLNLKGISAFVNAVTVDVAGIDQACTIPTQPVHTVINVFMEVDTIADTIQLGELVTDILQAVSESQEFADDISPRSAILTIYLDAPSERIYVRADYFVALQSYNDGLRGDELVEALGGFVFR